MKHIYFIYAAIPQRLFDNRIKFLISNADSFKLKHDKMFGLYCWTTKKKFAKDFIEIRGGSKIYSLIEKDMDIDEFEHFKGLYSNLELRYREYVHYEDSEEDERKMIEILSTMDEYVCSTIDKEEYIYAFGPDIYNINPKMFNAEIQEALEVLGYTEKYTRLFGEQDEIDCMEYNWSFGLTPSGHYNHLQVKDEMNVLLFLFHYLFYGV